MENLKNITPLDDLIPEGEEEQSGPDNISDMSESKAADGPTNANDSQRLNKTDANINDWDLFMRYINNEITVPNVGRTFICKIDKDIAASIASLKIPNKNKADIMNSILRAFIGEHRVRLSELRSKSKDTLLF